jgi:hypothetical protein
VLPHLRHAVEVPGLERLVEGGVGGEQLRFVFGGGDASP